jgi:carbon storage regulator
VLVLSRKIGQKILIGEKIAVTVVKVGHGGVRIGIEAPPEMPVVREELAEQLNRADATLSSATSKGFIDEVTDNLEAR